MSYSVLNIRKPLSCWSLLKMLKDLVSPSKMKKPVIVITEMKKQAKKRGRKL